MGQVNVTVGGRAYSLACADGEEAHLASLAAHLDRKAGDLQSALGQVSEPRMLLMIGILVADELFELRSGKAPPPPADDGLDGIAARLERLAETLEARGAST
jgi:cell division protein ZapA